MESWDATFIGANHFVSYRGLLARGQAHMSLSARPNKKGGRPGVDPQTS